MARPIGVFDSGVGGLTVLRALRESLPGGDFIYLGDTARLPYGTKSPQTVARYSLQCAAALVARGVGSLVVACNTASAFALDALKERHPCLPIIGVIGPGADAAIAASKSQHIAVIGTEGTIRGGAYQVALRRRNPDARVTARACSMFVALAEEGWASGEVAEVIAHRYLDPMFSGEDAPDTLVLGCTHFPILIEAIRAVLPRHVRLVDSAATTAAAFVRQLEPVAGSASSDADSASSDAGSASSDTGGGAVTWLATDDAQRFARVGGMFFGQALAAETVEIIDL